MTRTLKILFTFLIFFQKGFCQAPNPKPLTEIQKLTDPKIETPSFYVLPTKDTYIDNLMRSHSSSQHPDLFTVPDAVKEASFKAWLETRNRMNGLASSEWDFVSQHRICNTPGVIDQKTKDILLGSSKTFAASITEELIKFEKGDPTAFVRAVIIATAAATVSHLALDVDEFSKSFNLQLSEDSMWNRMVIRVAGDNLSLDSNNPYLQLGTTLSSNSGVRFSVLGGVSFLNGKNAEGVSNLYGGVHLPLGSVTSMDLRTAGAISHATGLAGEHIVSAKGDAKVDLTVRPGTFGHDVNVAPVLILTPLDVSGQTGSTSHYDPSITAAFNQALVMELELLV